MARPKVFVTRMIPRIGLDIISETADTEVWQDPMPPLYETLLEKVKGVNGLLCLITDKIDAYLMDAAGPSLKVISQMAVGFDNVDVSSATSRGILVGHTPGILTHTTADFTFTLLLAAARRVAEGDRYVKSGRWKTWDPTLLMGHDVYGATLGIVGFGRIGQEVSKRAVGFNMRILCYDHHSVEDAASKLCAEPCPLDELLAASDFVSLHVPMTPETYHLIGARELRVMKPTSILINASRGPVVDLEALHAALVSGEIAYAALDVTDPEPISDDDPLLILDNCLIVPHIASSSIATREKMAGMAADNLVAGLRGEALPHAANPELNYPQLS